MPWGIKRSKLPTLLSQGPYSALTGRVGRRDISSFQIISDEDECNHHLMDVMLWGFRYGPCPPWQFTIKLLWLVQNFGSCKDGGRYY